MTEPESDHFWGTREGLHWIIYFGGVISVSEIEPLSWRVEWLISDVRVGAVEAWVVVCAAGGKPGCGVCASGASLHHQQRQWEILTNQFLLFNVTVKM